MRLGNALAMGAVLLACASTPVREATDTVDWTGARGERTVQIVTIDPDGEERVTTIWLAVVDGRGYIRTSGTRWLANIERDRRVVLRLKRGAYRLRAEKVTAPRIVEQVEAAFAAKYGFQDTLARWFRGAGDATILRLTSRR